MNRSRVLISGLAGLLIIVGTAHAAIPLLINHQGIVKVNGLPFTGSGLFKFGFVDAANLWLWTNDGTHIGEVAGANFPNSAVTLPVTNGIYNVRLGDTAFINMLAMPSTVFDGSDVKLRIIFNDGVNGWQLLSPDQPVTSTAYAYHSASSDDSQRLQGLTASQVAVPSGTAVIGFTLPVPTGYSDTGIALSTTWTSKAPMPTARTFSGAAYVNGKIYVIGGTTTGSGNNRVGTNEAYDVAQNTWSTKTSMPTARTALGVAVVNNTICAIGGYGGTTMNESYDPLNNTWSTKAAMPTARYYAMTAVVNGIIYVIGGTVNGSSCLSVTEAYNPATDTWSSKAPMPTPRQMAGAAAVNGVIYVVGGFDGGTRFSTNEAYNPSTNTWTARAPMPTGRNSLSVAALHGYVFAIGGDPMTTVNERYDPVLDTWTTQSPAPTALEGMAIATVNDGTIYVLGGDNGTACVANNDADAPMYVYIKN